MLCSALEQLYAHRKESIVIYLLIQFALRFDYPLVPINNHTYGPIATHVTLERRRKLIQR
jgi:hypothetical protein